VVVTLGKSPLYNVQFWENPLYSGASHLCVFLSGNIALRVLLRTTHSGDVYSHRPCERFAVRGGDHIVPPPVRRKQFRRRLA